MSRVALLLAGFPEHIGGTTINRLCGSGLDAVANAARAIMLGEVLTYVGALVESMSRASWALPEHPSAPSRPAASSPTTRAAAGGLVRDTGRGGLRANLEVLARPRTRG